MRFSWSPSIAPFAARARSASRNRRSAASCAARTGLGVPLVVRSVKGIELTDYGSAFAIRARLIVEEIQHARRNRAVAARHDRLGVDRGQPDRRADAPAARVRRVLARPARRHAERRRCADRHGSRAIARRLARLHRHASVVERDTGPRRIREHSVVPDGVRGRREKPASARIAPAAARFRRCSMVRAALRRRRRRSGALDLRRSASTYRSGWSTARRLPRHSARVANGCARRVRAAARRRRTQVTRHRRAGSHRADARVDGRDRDAAACVADAGRAAFHRVPEGAAATVQGTDGA